MKFRNTRSRTPSDAAEGTFFAAIASILETEPEEEQPDSSSSDADSDTGAEGSEFRGA